MTDRDTMSVASEVFAALIARGEVDVVASEDAAGIEIQADSWTLAVEGAVAFLAIDDEPASVEEMTNALEGLIEPDDLAAIRELDRRLEGGLRVALQQSGDLLSMELATLLAEEPGAPA
jgi:hypothetical protein